MFRDTDWSCKHATQSIASFIDLMKLILIESLGLPCNKFSKLFILWLNLLFPSVLEIWTTSVFDIVRLQSTEVLQSREQPCHVPEGVTMWRSGVVFWICGLFPQSCIPLAFRGSSGWEAGERKIVFGCYPSLWNLSLLSTLPAYSSMSPCWMRGCVWVSVGASRTSEPSLSPPLESDLWFLPVFPQPGAESSTP